MSERPFKMICGVEWTSTVTAVPGSTAIALTVTCVPATGLFVVASIWATNCEPSVEAKVLAFGGNGVGNVVDAGGVVPGGTVVVVTGVVDVVDVVDVVGEANVVVVVVDDPVFGTAVVVVVVVDDPDFGIVVVVGGFEIGDGIVVVVIVIVVVVVVGTGGGGGGGGLATVTVAEMLVG